MRRFTEHRLATSSPQVQRTNSLQALASRSGAPIPRGKSDRRVNNSQSLDAPSIAGLIGSLISWTIRNPNPVSAGFFRAPIRSVLSRFQGVQQPPDKIGQDSARGAQAENLGKLAVFSSLPRMAHFLIVPNRTRLTGCPPNQGGTRHRGSTPWTDRDRNRQLSRGRIKTRHFPRFFLAHVLICVVCCSLYLRSNCS